MVEGKILSLGSNLTRLDTDKLFGHCLPEVLRFSRGFLVADIGLFWSGLLEHWLPLFHSLGAEVKLKGLNSSLEFPEDLERVTLIEVDGEAAVLGLDASSEAIFGNMVLPGGDVSNSVVIEYLERRLLTSLSKTWAGDEAIRFLYRGNSVDESVDIVGSIKAELELNGQSLSIFLGLGNQAVEKFDRIWRKVLLPRIEKRFSTVLQDEMHNLSVDIANLSVPAQALIDYTRAGTVIDLETKVSDRVSLAVDNRLCGSGILLRSEDSFVVRVDSLNTNDSMRTEASTTVSVRLIDLMIDEAGLLESLQEKAFIATAVPVDARVSICIGAEEIASAELAQVGENFAVKILSK